MSESTPLAPRLSNFPVSFFAVVMGLCGFVIATQKVEEMLEITDLPSTILLGISAPRVPGVYGDLRTQNGALLVAVCA